MVGGAKSIPPSRRFHSQSCSNRPGICEARERCFSLFVVEARAKVTQVKLHVSQLADPEKSKRFQDAQNQLTGALGRLLAVAENCPYLKSDANFPARQSQLEGTEDRILVAWRDNIEAVWAYNTEIRTLPNFI